jgi:hypothetical protein
MHQGRNQLFNEIEDSYRILEFTAAVNVAILSVGSGHNLLNCFQAGMIELIVHNGYQKNIE